MRKCILILTMILVPNVNKLINENKSRSEEKIEEAILLAAQEFVNDNRYNITVSGNTITKIGNDNVSNSIIPVNMLMQKGYVTETSVENKIVNPDNRNQCLKDTTGVKVTWDSSNKKYNYDINDFGWGSCY